MLEWLQYFIFAAVLFCSLSSVYYSVRSRKAESMRQRGIFAARTNIFMGLMLTLIAFTQLFLFISSYIRMGVGVVFLLLGLFNLFAGIRNHNLYSKVSEDYFKPGRSPGR